jgi:DNA-binding CsgD family transcriptional regulator
VRAEIALHLGIVHYRRSEHGEAARLLAEVPPEADIVYAQALEYRAWVANALGDYERAATLFDDALSTIPRCRHYDRFVDATTLLGLAILVAELPRLERWPDVLSRLSSINWSAPGLNVSHFWLAEMASLIEEMRGDRDEAIRWASIAENAAPTATSIVAATCRLAAATGRYGEAYAHRYFVRKARRMYDELPRDAAFRAEYFLAVTVAEEIAAGDAPLDAAPLLIYHREAVEPLIRRRPQHGMLTAIRDAVEARLEHARGNRAGAVLRYSRAFDVFARMGYRRRASIVAYRLAELTGDARYREYAAEALRDAGDAYWVKASFARLGVGEVQLSERHLAILRLVAEGRTNKEIGTARGISALTARNAVRELLRRFGATNRTELGRLARERGVV